MQIRNRIKELRMVTPDEVRPNAKNWRTHPQAQRDALRGVLAQVGIAAPVIAYETPEGLTLIDGHERMTVGVAFPCVVLDVDEQEADTLLATFDPIGAMAETNHEKLETLLRSTTLESPALIAMVNDMQPTIASLPVVEFKEYGEEIVDTVEYHECPSCGHTWPK